MRDIIWSIGETEDFQKRKQGEGGEINRQFKFAARIVDYKERKGRIKFTFNMGEKLCVKKYAF